MPRTIALIIAFLLLAQSVALPLGLNDPFVYPYGTIGNRQPHVIWIDKYNERDREKNVRYRITVTRKSLPGGQTPVPEAFLAAPQLYKKFFFGYQLPRTLDEGAYDFSIERLIDGEAVTSRHYSYRKYPIRETFVLDTRSPQPTDALPPERLIDYAELARANSVNGYNILFYSGAATVSAGLGALIWFGTDRSLVWMILAGICFGSAAAGYTASGYYTYQYVSTRRALKKIIDLGPRMSLMGGTGPDDIAAGIQLSF